jgi:hypothetical protein
LNRLGGEGQSASPATTKPNRLWFRISIRMMLLIVLLIAVLLGWQVNKARVQREAVESVQRYGGWVHYDCRER